MRNLRILIAPAYRQCGVARALSETAGSAAVDFLFGPTPRTFRSLGLREELCKSLESTGRGVATVIQAASFEHIVQGESVVLAAETGTGKTLAYLCPLIHRLVGESILGSSISSEIYPAAVILIPNKELGCQVLAMAKELLLPIGDMQRSQRKLIGDVWDLDNDKPFSKRSPSPLILVSTPKFITNILRNGHEEVLFSNIRHLVLDEADLLLDGDFVKQVEIIMTSLKKERRKQISNGVLKVHEDLVQKILSAATLPSSGKKSIAEYVDRHFGRLLHLTNENVHKHHPRISQEFVEVHRADDGDVAVSPANYVDSIIESIYSFSRRVAQQEGQVEERPDIIRSSFSVDRCSTEDKFTGTIDSLEKSEDVPATIIFVNTAKRALELTAALKHREVSCVQFHKLMTGAARVNALERFKKGEVRILVATGQASRGLDIPIVKHVIQAEFAENVVEYLHRVGRASRGGVAGHATNFYSGKQARYLIEEILRNTTEDSGDNSIENSFSRKRGLRRRIKRFEALNLTSDNGTANGHIRNDDTLL